MELNQFLLQNGADPHRTGIEHGNVLHANALQTSRWNDNNIGVLSLFLQLGVNVNQEGGSFGTPLQAAAYEGMPVSMVADKVKVAIDNPVTYPLPIKQSKNFRKSRSFIRIQYPRGLDSDDLSFVQSQGLALGFVKL